MVGKGWPIGTIWGPAPRDGSDRRVTHGGSKTRTYKSWDCAKQRCYNPNDKRYAAYGGLGVIMCESWRTDYSAFFAYMGDRPPGTSLDRWPDPYGNYEPGNCRWATLVEQRANRRKPHGLSRPYTRPCQTRKAALSGSLSHFAQSVSDHPSRKDCS